MSKFETSDLWLSHFNKTTETARAGSYNVYLADPKVGVELLAVSQFSGIHR